MDNETPAEAIKKAEEMQGLPIQEYRDEYFNPSLNDKVISIVRQDDGNYKVFGQRNGKMKEFRGGKPEDVLGEFLTSS